jgi:hypothetical protein
VPDFEEILSRDGNEDLRDALAAAEKDFADVDRLLNDSSTVDVHAVDPTDTIGSVAPDGTLFVLGYREADHDNSAVLCVAVGNDIVWMPICYATEIAEWLTSRVIKATERGKDTE